VIQRNLSPGGEEEAVPDDYEQIDAGDIFIELREPQPLFASRESSLRASLENTFIPA
jgi:hypothetical protein